MKFSPTWALCGHLYSLPRGCSCSVASSIASRGFPAVGGSCELDDRKATASTSGTVWRTATQRRAALPSTLCAGQEAMQVARRMQHRPAHGRRQGARPGEPAAVSGGESAAAGGRRSARLIERPAGVAFAMNDSERQCDDAERRRSYDQRRRRYGVATGHPGARRMPATPIRAPPVVPPT